MWTAFTLIVMLIVSYAFMVEGIFGAFTMFVNVIIAGLVAFNFWEPLAGYLEPNVFDTVLQGYEDALSLTAIFWLVLVLLRVATTQFAPAEIEVHPAAQRGGGALFGMLTGYLVSGFLLCVFQTLPWQVRFLSFEPDYQAEQVTRSYIPSDRVWLAMMSRAGSHGFAGDDETFDPQGTFELRYARYRRVDKSHPLPYYGEFDRDVYQQAQTAAGAPAVPPGLTGGAPPPAAGDATKK